MNLKKIIVSVFITLFLSFSITEVMAFAFDVPQESESQMYGNYVGQEKSKWCWAASAENAAKWEVSTTRTQRDAVKYLKGSLLNQYPDVTGTMSDACRAAEYISNNTLSYQSASRMSFAFLCEQVFNSHPVMVGSSYYYSGVYSGGHMMLVVGWTTYNNTETIVYYDPWNGGSRVSCTYDDFCNGTINNLRYEETGYLK